MAKFSDFILDGNLERRPEQETMASTIASVISGKSEGIIEAEPGYGKSYAYLFPVIDYLLKNERAKVVISTATHTLQDQIVGKDLPAVMNYFRKHHKSELNMADVGKLIGSGNFLCEDDPVFKLPDDSDNTRLNTIKGGMSAVDFKKIKKLVEKTKKSRKPVTQRELPKMRNEAWQEMACRGLNGCKCYDKTGEKRCGYSKYMRSGMDARIIVTNHHYLVAAGGMFANKDIVIVDEAHKLPEVLATQHSKELKLSRIQWTINEFLKLTANPSMFYSKDMLSKLYAVRSLSHDISDRLSEFSAHVTAAMQAGKKQAATFEEALKDFPYEIFSDEGKASPAKIANWILTGSSQAAGRNTAIVQRNITWLKDALEKEQISEKRIKETVEANPGEAGDVKTITKNVKDDKSRIHSILNALSKSCDDIGEIATMEAKALFSESRKHSQQQNAPEKTTPFQERMKKIAWCELTGKGNLSLMSAPLDHKYAQRLAFFQIASGSVYQSNNVQTKKSLLMISATISTSSRSNKPDFNHFKDELGIGFKTPVTELMIPSSYPYEKMVNLIIPKNMPQPKYSSDAKAKSPETEEYYRTVAETICKSLKNVDGNSLVLCSSMWSVDYIANYVEEYVKKNKLYVEVLNQLHGQSVDRMVNRMRSGVQPQKVMIGMQSMWQGIDLQGEALRGLFIVKIPFQTPNHPLTVERSKAWFELYQKNYFSDVSVRQACSMMRQGLGRLIRGGDENKEYGVVVCFDPRFSAPKGERKAYMREIEAAFPEGMLKTRTMVNFEEVEEHVKTFFDEKKKLRASSNNIRESEEEELQVVGIGV